MNPRVAKVSPLENYQLLLTFTNGEERVFDMNPYLEKGMFRELKNQSIFRSVKVFLGSIQWINGLDLCPDTLYLNSTKRDIVPEDH
ncbi:MAG: DUF2442 domain-containing protein [Bacteroidetes bacterium]|nr:DUF2442 domain-containing protein [Bacteroidota bacterium]